VPTVRLDSAITALFAGLDAVTMVLAEKTG